MRPTYALVVTVLAAGAVLALRGVEAGVLAAAVVAAGAGVDALRLPKRRSVAFRRVLPPRLVAGRPFAVRLEAELRTRRRTRLDIRDEPPPTAPAAPVVPLAVEPGRTNTAAYETVVPERGPAAFGRVFWRSRGILLERVGVVSAPTEALVYPDFVRAPVQMPSGSGGSQGRSAQLGHSGQFESLREYRAQDPYRLINWKATARRGRPLVNTYRTDSDQPVLVLVDTGRALFGRLDGRPRLDHALAAAYAAAAEAVNNDDRVGLLVYDNQLRASVPPASGLRALRAVARDLARAELHLVESDHVEALAWASTAAGRRSLVIWFTDLAAVALPDELAAFVKRLTRRHVILQLTVSRRDAEADGDVWQDAAHALLDDEAVRMLARLQAAGVHVVRGRTLTPDTIRAYRRVKERGLV